MATTIASTGELILIGTSKTTVNGVEFTANGATAAGGLIAPTLKPAADSTTALQFQTSGGVAVVTIDTTNARIGINMTPTEALDVTGNAKFSGVLALGGTAISATKYLHLIASLASSADLSGSWGQLTNIPTQYTI